MYKVRALGGLKVIMAEVGAPSSSSKSRKKRLNRKAKYARVESSLKAERERRAAAEKTSIHWKEKAKYYKR